MIFMVLEGLILEFWKQKIRRVFISRGAFIGGNMVALHNIMEQMKNCVSYLNNCFIISK